MPSLFPALSGRGYQEGVAPVIPHGAGAQQSIRGGEVEGQGSQLSVDLA
jgi:hypothetical protein